VRRALALSAALCACGAPQLPPNPPAAPTPVAAAPSPPPAPPPSGSWAPTHAPPTVTHVSDQTRRLARLAHLWGRIRYLDPTLFEHTIDWDAAVSRAIPQVMAATTEDDEAAAVSRMLAELHDPVTRLVDTAHDESPPRVAYKTSSSTDQGVLVVTLAADLLPDSEQAKRILNEVSAAKSVVIDLRANRGEADSIARILDSLAGALLSRDLVGGTKRWVSHEGFLTQRGVPGGGYRTTFASDIPHVLLAAPGHHPRNVAFVVNEGSGAPELALSMQRNGDATIIAHGPLPDPAAADALFFPYADHHVAIVRGYEALEAAEPDAVVPLTGRSQEQQAVDAAIVTLKRPRGASPPRKPPSPLRLDRDNVYAEEKCPPLEHRLLALFRLWTVIDLFYPYKSLLDAPWSDVLDEFIPRFIDATTPRAYELAIREASARLQDSHVWVAGGEELYDWLGHGHLPFHVRRVEGSPVVTSILAPASDEKAKVDVGDVVVAIDGQSFPERRASFEKYVAGSTPDYLANVIDDHALRCDEGKSLDVALMGADGAAKHVSMPCVAWFRPPRSGPVVRTLGDVGYVDLERLEPSQVDAMFEKLAGTRGIVFDMRGYPHGIAWFLAAHLKTDPAPAVAALTSTMLVAPPTYQDEAHIDSRQTLTVVPSMKKYTGKTVMLIDDRAMSAAEHTGLMLEAANGTKFVGSPSAGANGYTTWVCLPGNLCVTFSGAGVRHGDGRQLQRVGLQPDIPVRPTIAGVRAGTDEVLERAVTYLRTAH
jgi:C-terminal processing protease CtpA/Prc